MGTKDSLKKLLTDLPDYKKQDYYNNIPYDRAANVCKTRDEMEDCLEHISAEASRKGMDENAISAFYAMNLQNFLLAHGETLYDLEPPEDIVEIGKLEKQLEDEKKKHTEVVEQLKEAERNRQIIIFESPVPVESSFPFSYSIGGRKLELDLDDHFFISEDGGIFYLPEGREEGIELCSHYVAPSAYVKGLDGSETVNLLYFRDGEWHEIKQIKKSALLNSNSVAKLLIDNGIDANQEAEKYLAEYFRVIEKKNRKTKIPIYITASQMGWNDESFQRFLPFTENCTPPNNKNYSRIFIGLQAQCGSLEGWIEAIRQIRNAQHVQTRAILAASFVSPLIRPLNGMRFVVNVFGESHIGKSVSFRMAAGVWGNPDIIILSFGSTLQGSVQHSNFLSDIPLILDESEIDKHQKDFDEFIYTMCSEYSRVKANTDEDPAISKNCIFVSGEHPLLKNESNGGAKRRVLNIGCKTSLFFDKEGNDRFISLINSNYGFAGKHYVEWLCKSENLQQAITLNSQYLQEFDSGRQARIAAALLTADTLIDELFFHDRIRLTPKDLKEFLLQEDDSANEINYAHIHQSIEKFIMEQAEKNGYGEETDYGIAKKQRGQTPALFAFKENKLEAMIAQFGGDMKTYLEWAQLNKKLAAGNDEAHKYQRQVIMNKKRGWYYAVVFPKNG